MLNSDEVKRIALEVGFDACGIARAARLGDEEYPLRQWLDKGWHGDLGYMERNVDMRLDPRLLVPGARSVICCLSVYPPPTDTGGTAAFAQTRDYHSDIKRMLLALRDRLGIEAKPCCDTVPIADKHWAARAGLGWIGRHTLLVTPQWGSWVNLGELVTTEECSEYSEHSDYSEYADHCMHCKRCVSVCPNGAIAPEGSPMIDVRRCVSYYTTPKPQPMPEGFDTGGYTYGCDLCQLACPFNQFN